jgi:hypothetical protein
MHVVSFSADRDSAGCLFSNLRKWNAAVTSSGPAALLQCSFLDSNATADVASGYDADNAVVWSGAHDGLLVEGCTFAGNIGHDVLLEYSDAPVYSDDPALNAWDAVIAGPHPVQPVEAVPADVFLTEDNTWLLQTKQVLHHSWFALFGSADIYQLAVVA